MTKPELIRAVGHVVFGRSRTAGLAMALGASKHLVRRWMAGTDEPGVGRWGDLRELLRQKRAALLAFSAASKFREGDERDKELRAAFARLNELDEALNEIDSPLRVQETEMTW